MAVAADGSVYVTGATEVTLIHTTSCSGILSGALLWMRTYNGASNYSDYGHGVAVAADGSVYVNGMTEVVATGPNCEQYDE